MFTLYCAPHTCSIATHLALEHAGANYRLKRVNFASAEQRSPAYLKLNPKGRVPALETPLGILTETPALLSYIAESFPQCGLAPLDDTFAMAQMAAFNSYLCSSVHVAHAHRMRGARWADDPAAWVAMQTKVPQSVGEAFGLIETDYLRGPWVLGTTFSVADYYLLTMSRWLEGDGVDLARLQRVLAHRQTMLDMPLVQRVIAQAEAV